MKKTSIPTAKYEKDFIIHSNPDTCTYDDIM